MVKDTQHVMHAAKRCRNLVLGNHVHFICEW